MLTDNTKLKYVYRLLIIAVAAALIVLAYSIYATVHTLYTTGTLEVETSKPQSIITISRVASDAEVIGMGTAQIRLRSGVYLVAANFNGNHATKVIHIAVRQTTKVKLTPVNNTSPLPQANFISFEALESHGLTNSQLGNAEQLFLEFNKKARVVKIDPMSIESFSPGASSGNPTFLMTFDVTIDSATYKASLNYTGLENVSLTITDPQTGSQVYSGSTATQSSPDS